MAAMLSTRSGFSFIELLIVLAIVGILSTMGYGYMIAAKPHAELEAAEVQLVSFLNQARNHAVSDEVTSRVVFLPELNQFKMEYQDTGGTWHQIGGVKELHGVSFAGEGVTLANNEARFTPRGTLHWGGSITIASSNGETSTLTANIATGKFPLAGGNLR